MTTSQSFARPRRATRDLGNGVTTTPVFALTTITSASRLLFGYGRGFVRSGNTFDTWREDRVRHAYLQRFACNGESRFFATSTSHVFLCT